MKTRFLVTWCSGWDAEREEYLYASEKVASLAEAKKLARRLGKDYEWAIIEQEDFVPEDAIYQEHWDVSRRWDFHLGGFEEVRP